MPLIIFQKIVPGVEYACHPDHRNGNPNKSQWTISQGEEVQSFTHSHAQAWIVGSRGWGLHLANGAPEYLGTAVERGRRLFVARFEDGNANQKWHGYPADHQSKANDRLPEELKQLWLQNNVLAPAKVRKLAKVNHATYKTDHPWSILGYPALQRPTLSFRFGWLTAGTRLERFSAKFPSA